MVCLCVYSHSDYFDILKIQIDYIKSLKIPCDIYLFVNIPFDFSGGKRTISKTAKRRYGSRKRLRGGNHEKFKTILYDDKVPYFQRLSYCIKQIPSSHLILTHDNDILLQFDIDAINKMIDAMNANNIDAIKLTDDLNVKPEIHIKDTLYISKHSDNDTYVFNVQPRIWRKESALNFYSRFPQKNYRNCETANVQAFSKTQRIYVVYDTNIIKSHYSPTKYYIFMHLTWEGEILQYNKKQNVNSLITTEYTKVKNKYLKNTTRIFHL